MKKFALILFLLSSVAQAQTVPFGATNYTGEKSELRAAFATLWKNFKELDAYHCYRRAHVISYQMTKMGIQPNKVFYFRGDKLQTDLNWWYHVAPMVYYQGLPVVMDRGLVDGATHLNDWLDALSKGNTCLEVKSMNEQREHQATEYCTYMVAPMYYYTPDSLETLDRTHFLMTDLQDMIYSIGLGKRSLYLNTYPLAE